MFKKRPKISFSYSLMWFGLYAPLLFHSLFSFAADGRADYDLDDDGLIEINDLADLDEIRNNPDGKTLYGSNVGCPDAQDGTLNGGCFGFELTTDLNFDTNQDGEMDGNDAYWNDGYGWRPIEYPSISDAFWNTFDGNGHVIRNLFINRSNSYDQGLFGYAYDAKIRNLVLTGPLMHVNGGYHVGALVGVAIDTEIKNVFTTGKVEGINYVGGLVGSLATSSLENGVHSGVVSGQNCIGGLIGDATPLSFRSSVIRNGLSVGLVSGMSNEGGAVGCEYSGSHVLESTYWALDSTTQANSTGESEISSYVGISLSKLKCAIQANTNSSNSDCVSDDGSDEGLIGPVNLFNEWDQAIQDGQALWDFGSDDQLPALVLNGNAYRDSDGDGVLDVDDAWPLIYAASIDGDNDGYPDAWNVYCGTQCIENSGLLLDQLPLNADAWQDLDLDGLPDSWADSCDATCQSESDLVLDAHLNDTDNDDIDNPTDTDDNNDGITDIDVDSDGLVDVDHLNELNAIRYQLDGIGQRMNDDDLLDNSGCPTLIHQGVLVNRCHGYELTSNLNFDTNLDGVLDSSDSFWNGGDGWVAIGTNHISNQFNSTFEGNGYLIRNLYINRSGSDGQGLFGRTKNAVIQNIGLTGSLMSLKGNSSVGALIGSAYSTEIKNVFNSGFIQGNGHYTGGLVGFFHGSTLVNSFNTGVVTGYRRVGGLIGFVSSVDSTDINIIQNGFNVGRVSGSNEVGGAVGSSYTRLATIIENLYWASDSSGQVTSAGQSEDNSYVGLPIVTLKCAIQANTDSSNSDCVSEDGSDEGLTGPVNLFNSWNQAIQDDQPLWEFGGVSQLPALVIKGNTYRDNDFDGVLDFEDSFPSNSAANQDLDSDGYPDAWSFACDAECIENSGLELDQFPENADVWQDLDLDGLPDSWADTCDATCQSESDLVLDVHFNDTDNDGIDNQNDTDDDNDGVTDIDADSDGLVDIDSLEELNAIRYQLNGFGLRMGSDSLLDQSGCPEVIHEGLLVNHCYGYELTTNLDFDTNQDGVINENDTYWNDGEGWVPIGSLEPLGEFNSTFEGNGHIIRNLHSNSPSSDYGQGLFGHVQNAKIRNIGLSGSLMSVHGRNYVGALIGMAKYSEINNVFNTGLVQGGYSYTGGLIGYLENSSLVNSFNTGEVVGVNGVGGVVGRVRSNEVNQFSIIRNSFNTGKITGDSATGGTIASNFRVSFSLLENLYWSTDVSNQLNSSGQTEDSSYVGLPLPTLQCAIQANTDSSNSDCVSEDGSDEGLVGPVTLFNNWGLALQGDQPIWDFGNSNQLPALILNGNIYRDSDGDGSLDADDVYPFDYDNDGVPDLSDEYPFISVEGLLDTDNDGVPNDCDSACEVLGMIADTDDDNDSVLDINDTYPLISIGDFLDTDNDGAPDTCNASCMEFGMQSDLDDDNDGLLDINDAFPLVSIVGHLDTDNDGAPDTCDETCQLMGMTADMDDDNDGVPDELDPNPINGDDGSPILLSLLPICR